MIFGDFPCVIWGVDGFIAFCSQWGRWAFHCHHADRQAYKYFRGPRPVSAWDHPFALCAKEADGAFNQLWWSKECEKEEEGKEKLVKGSMACDFIALIVSPTPMILKLLWTMAPSLKWEKSLLEYLERQKKKKKKKKYVGAGLLLIKQISKL